jgi:hypothetical protein
MPPMACGFMALAITTCRPSPEPESEATIMYLLHHNPACAPRCRAGTFPTLAEAMAAVSCSPAYLGDGGPADWITAVNIPGKLFLAAAAYVEPAGESDEVPPPLWIIEAPGVAREAAGLMTTGQLDSRSWSTSDPYFFAAAAEMRPHLEAWCAPAAAAGVMHAADAALCYGLPFDSLFREVMRSNMSKTSQPGQPEPIKGEHHELPRIAEILQEAVTCPAVHPGAATDAAGVRP